MGKEDEMILVDAKTGEIKYELKPGDTLQHITPERKGAIEKAKKKKYHNKEIKSWNKDLGGFIFVMYEYCNLILKEHEDINDADITKLFYLATYVDYEGYLLDNGEKMDRSKMRDILNISLRQFDTFFNKMIKNSILKKEDKIIKVNTDYFYRGGISKEIKINHNYIRLYSNSIQYLYRNVKTSKHKQLGLYFRLIPYVHRQRNALCHNPDSKAEDIEMMTARELKEIIGYHESGLRKFINSLFSIKLKNGESILVTVRNDADEGKSYILMNPKVMYGGNFYLKDGKNTITKWFVRTN